MVKRWVIFFFNFETILQYLCECLFKGANKFLLNEERVPSYLTHYHTIPHFDALEIYSCGKHCEKMRNCL